MPLSAIDRIKASKAPHIVSPIPHRFPGSATARTMLVSSPLEVDALIRRIPTGQLLTLDEVRAHLAQRHGTDMTCPVSTAIFINVVARAAEEYAALGETDVAPYWRVLRGGGWLNEKYPGGLPAQRRRLEEEGHQVLVQGRRLRIDGYEQFLFAL